MTRQANKSVEENAAGKSEKRMKNSKSFYTAVLGRNKITELFSKVFLMSPALMAIIRFEDHVFLDINHRFTRFTGYSREEIIGHSIPEVELLSREDHEHIFRILQTKGAVYNEEVQYRTKSGNIRRGIYSAELIDVYGEKLIVSVHHDITERRQVQAALEKKEYELTQLSAELEDANNTLRVILKSRMDDQKNLEARLQQNISELVMPYIMKLENYNLDERGKSYLNILKSNIKDILSPFLNTIYSGYKDLTPAEIQIAVMVRKGIKSKNISELLGVSVGTVDTHRNNIRKKLGLKQGKTNLHSFLLAIS